jgi:hypothetical protein
VFDNWLDADSFIKPYRNEYAFNLVPKFWTYLEQKAEEKVIVSCHAVLEDFRMGNPKDKLLEWAENLGEIMFLMPTDDVQLTYKQVIEYVQNNGRYAPHWVADFINGSDPWLIAHAKTLGGRIVTFEESVPINSKKVKLPDVADVFGVDCISLYNALNELGACFT